MESDRVLINLNNKSLGLCVQRPSSFILFKRSHFLFRVKKKQQRININTIGGRGPFFPDVEHRRAF
jgi:hypothetical protein